MSNIVLYDFCKDVDKLNTETNKNDFITNYKNYKQNINEIDAILEQPSSVDTKLDISDILILLVDLDSKNINYLSVAEIKYYKDLLELLETKISNNNQNITTL
jgi:glutaredoxin 2